MAAAQEAQKKLNDKLKIKDTSCGQGVQGIKVEWEEA